MKIKKNIFSMYRVIFLAVAFLIIFISAGDIDNGSEYFHGLF